MELGHFNKLFVKNARKKKVPQAKILELFVLDHLFFVFEKRQGRPPPGCAPADYARIVNMPQCSHNKIITFVTVIFLEFLSARFEHSGALLLLCFSNKS